MRILVVEDEPIIAETLLLIFRRNGFDASSAGDADQALASVRESTPDLVLCDIDLPGRDGITLMRDLGREFPKCPIFVLTGLYPALSRVRECALTLSQPVRIFTKPCRPTDLLDSAGMLRMMA